METLRQRSRERRQKNGRGTGGVTDKGFMPGRSGNPAGRPKGLARTTRELVGENGMKLVEFWVSTMEDPMRRDSDRLEESWLLADRVGARLPPTSRRRFHAAREEHGGSTDWPLNGTFRCSSPAIQETAPCRQFQLLASARGLSRLTLNPKVAGSIPARPIPKAACSSGIDERVRFRLVWAEVLASSRNWM